MFYLNPDYNNYKYLVSASDNFLVLTDSSYSNGAWNSPDTLNVIYAYFNPPYVIETKLNSYDSVNYRNISSQFSDNLYDRADFPSILFIQFVTIILICFVVNQLSKLFKKGGIFGFN